MYLCLSTVAETLLELRLCVAMYAEYAKKLLTRSLTVHI